jgi:hypothetical protein
MANSDFSVFRRIAWAALVLGIAALGVFLVQRNPPASPLPEYELAITGGAQTTQGAPAQLRADMVRARAGVRVQISARPTAKPEGEVVARAFVLEGGAAKEWKVPIEIAEDGVLRIAGDAGSIFPEPSGDWDVVLAVARPQVVPTATNIVSLLASASPIANVKTVRCRVVVAP